MSVNKHLLFIYGTLKLGYHNHHLLHSANFMADYTTERAYTMKNLGSFPAVIPNGNIRIIGELYLVNDSTLDSLDKLEGYPHPGGYDRIEIETSKGTAFMYVMTDEQTTKAEIIPDGLWLP